MQGGIVLEESDRPSGDHAIQPGDPDVAEALARL
jgi:hypothetical protein